MASAKLPSSDCHATLRKKILEKEIILQPQSICSTVIWEWQYLGFTEERIHGEVSQMLSNAHCNPLTDNNNQSLPIPETALITMAYGLIAKHNQTQNNYEKDLSAIFIDKCVGKMDVGKSNNNLIKMSVKTERHGRTSIVNTVDDTTYSSIDIDLHKLMPAMKDDFVNTFKLPGFFLGGSHCMLNMVRNEM